MSSKNVVFALQSFGKGDNLDVKEGVLLFPTEAKADDFLEVCSHINKSNVVCHYEKLYFVTVADFIADKVHTNKQFYLQSEKLCERVVEETI